nr:immunoglobulin heavy chain junction region [Mus musculus]
CSRSNYDWYFDVW